MKKRICIWSLIGILIAMTLGIGLIKKYNRENPGAEATEPKKENAESADPVKELAGKQVDLILFMGQSNMSGAVGNASEAPEVQVGWGYEYRPVTSPGALWHLKEPLGELEHKEGYLDDRELLDRKGTMASAFVNAYYEETKTPVVAIAASRGSSSMNSWLERLWEDAVSRMAECREYLEGENVTVRHCFMVWMQGEADANKKRTQEEYCTDMIQLLDHMEEAGVEHCFLIQIGNNNMQPGHHDEIQKAQLALCELDERVTLVSTLPASLDEELDELGVHFNQKALNLIGEDAGHHAGAAVAEGIRN